MSGVMRWRSNWLVVGPPGTLRVDVERSPRARRAARSRLADVPAGTPIALFASGPGAIGRCRAFATRAGVELDRAYLAFPSAAAPAYLVEDAPDLVRVFVKTVLAAPPRARFATPIALALEVIRCLSPWRLIRALAPGHVAVGRRA
jgi:hypothetical protein